MDSPCHCSIGSPPELKDSCISHVSIYYEQNQQQEELTDNHPIYSCSSEEEIFEAPPVEIHEENTTSIDLPPLAWHGYDNPPKLLTVTNTGRTILINGHWANSRPYIEGGPLNGTYLFSQIHFHCPSEHEIDGRRYPLEMHIVHYKTSYLTQERAMNEKDGTVVLVYLFKLMDACESIMSQITKLAPHLTEVNSRTESTEISLGQLIIPFISNYYVYWGSVTTKKNCYLLQWIINCSVLGVTQKEVDELSNIITCAIGVKVKQTLRVKPENDAIYHVGQEDYSLPALKTFSADDVCNMCRHQEVPYVSCECKWKKLNPSRTDPGASGVLICNCKSRVHVRKSRCRMQEGGRFCSRCKSIESTCSRCCGVRQGISRYLSCLKYHRLVQSKRRMSKFLCELGAEEPDGTVTISCESANGSSLSSLWDEKSTKKKKSKKKKKTSGRKSRKSSDRECEKSSSKSSKSSAGDDKSKASSGKGSGKSGSEATSDTECKKKKNNDAKDLESNKGSNHKSQSGNLELACEKTEGKEHKKINEAAVIESLFKLKQTSSIKTLKTSTELCGPNLSSSGLLLVSQKSSAPSDGTEGNTKKDSESAELKTLPDCELTEQRSSVSSADKEKKNVKLSKDALKSPGASRCMKSRSRSPANVQKLKDRQSSERKSSIDSASRSSKSKSPVSDVQKKKARTRKESTHDENMSSKSKVSVVDSIQSKIGKRKKGSDCNVSQSVQEVKCPVTKSTAGIENMKCDSKSPGDVKIKYNKLPKKESTKLVISKSKEERQGKTKANSGGPKCKQDYDITTLFEKKQDDRKSKSFAGDGSDVKVNFLLTPPSNNKNIPSFVSTTSESDGAEEKKAHEDTKGKRSHFLQDFTVNTATIPGSEFAQNKLKEVENEKQLKEGSQVCLLMQHIFRKESKGKVCKSSSQEYHVAIMCDQKIMQEYKGKFHPQELQLGNYEILQLVPMHLEPEKSSFRLQDCSVKKDSLDQICIRLKFLLKEVNVRHTSANTGNGLSEISEKRGKLLFDRGTQCNKFDLVGNPGSKALKENQSNKNVMNYWSNEILGTESKSKREERQKNQSKNKSIRWETKTAEAQKYTAKLKSDPDVHSQDPFQSSAAEDFSTESHLKENKMETTHSEQCDKKLKPLFVKRRKTVYFIYDKVEKDEGTGKKVFVGSFRTKEEVEDLKKQKKLLQDNELVSASEKFEETSEVKYFLPLESKEIDLEAMKLKESSVLKKSSPDRNSPSTNQDASSNKKKDVVTLHKYKPKHSEVNRSKKECKNVLIGKVVDNMHRGSESSKNLTKITSVDNQNPPKISIYELQETSGSESQKENPDPDTSKREKKSQAKNVAKGRVDRFKPEVIVPEKSNKAEEDSARDNSQKSLDKKESQAALILIPVEVESLSKIEVILIEHLDNLKKDKEEDEHIPCSNPNK